jgi:hypothetical protein
VLEDLPHAPVVVCFNFGCVDCSFGTLGAWRSVHALQTSQFLIRVPVSYQKSPNRFESEVAVWIGLSQDFGQRLLTPTPAAALLSQPGLLRAG